MKLSISNIAWDGAVDEQMYEIMSSLGFSGLEIAPTRIFGTTPYEDLQKVSEWYDSISRRFVIPSMQSIWYGRKENLFGSDDEREALLEYTRKAILFAQTVHCNNLVFGCPRNRNNSEGKDDQIAVEIFKELGAYAMEHNTVIGIEANPPIYNTNFLNTTKEALDFIERIGSPGVKLNLDTGTMIQNEEDISVFAGRESYINHVHISEPGLADIQIRSLHRDLMDMLKRIEYESFVSIETGKHDELTSLIDTMSYVRKVFGDNA